ncbi:MAG: ABC transporter permease [Chloroflexota bacterium]
MAAPPVASDIAWLEVRATSLRVRTLRALLHDRAAVLGVVLFFLLVVAGVFAGQIAPFSPIAVHIQDRLQGPSATYLLGTDELGRDLLSRLIYGARASLTVGVLSLAIASGAGVPIGLISGYYGGLADGFLMRAMDGLLAFPAIILALAIVTALGPNLVDAAIAIGVVYVPTFARITRGSVLTLKGNEFVEAARVGGATNVYLLGRVLLPNSLSPLLVQVTVSFAQAILTEAALSFLGLGVQPPAPSWGGMLNTGRQFLTQTPWYSFSAGAAIFLAVLSLNLLGDGLRDALDPRLQRTL